MTPAQWRERSSWARQFLEANPDASVDDVAREAEKAGFTIPREMASKARREFRQSRSMPDEGPSRSMAPLVPPVIPSLVCGRCGQPGHWISQCTEILVLPVVEFAEYYAAENDPVPEVKSEPVPEAPPEEEPMTPAQSETPKPEAGRARTVEGTFIRRRRLNEIVEENPEIHPMEAIVQLRREYGIGLDFNYTYETVRIARELNKLPPLRSREDASGREFGEREKVTLLDPAEAAVEAEEQRLTPDEELEWVATRIGEIVRAHNLSEVNIRTENGSLVWDYEIRVRKSGKKVL